MTYVDVLIAVKDLFQYGEQTPERKIYNEAIMDVIRSLEKLRETEIMKGWE